MSHRKLICLPFLFGIMMFSLCKFSFPFFFLFHRFLGVNVLFHLPFDILRFFTPHNFSNCYIYYVDKTCNYKVPSWWLSLWPLFYFLGAIIIVDMYTLMFPNIFGEMLSWQPVISLTGSLQESSKIHPLLSIIPLQFKYLNMFI